MAGLNGVPVWLRQNIFVNRPSLLFNPQQVLSSYLAYVTDFLLPPNTPKQTHCYAWFLPLRPSCCPHLLGYIQRLVRCQTSSRLSYFTVTSVSLVFFIMKLHMNQKF